MPTVRACGQVRRGDAVHHRQTCKHFRRCGQSASSGVSCIACGNGTHEISAGSCFAFLLCRNAALPPSVSCAHDQQRQGLSAFAGCRVFGHPPETASSMLAMLARCPTLLRFSPSIGRFGNKNPLGEVHIGRPGGMLGQALRYIATQPRRLIWHTGG